MTTQPDRLWNFILVTLGLPEAAPHIGMVGAGPLEDLISTSGARMLDAIRHERLQNERLQDALAEVWLGHEDRLDVIDDYIALGCQLVS